LKKEWDRKSISVLNELSRASTAYNPDDWVWNEDVVKPIAQCRLDILPGASNEAGTLEVEVCHSSFSWCAAIHGRRRLCRASRRSREAALHPVSTLPEEAGLLVASGSDFTP